MEKRNLKDVTPDEAIALYKRFDMAPKAGSSVNTGMGCCVLGVLFLAEGKLFGHNTDYPQMEAFADSPSEYLDFGLGFDAGFDARFGIPLRSHPDIPLRGHGFDIGKAVKKAVLDGVLPNTFAI
jgi:hypothetical protein